MGRFVVGDVVVVRFPFTDFSEFKKRPALVLAELPYQDYLICQITSQYQPKQTQIQIDSSDFARGTLKKTSYARADFLMTFSESAILYSAGAIHEEKLGSVVDAVIGILRPEVSDEVEDSEEDGSAGNDS